MFFGSEVALGFTVVSDTQITAIAPPGQVGTVDVQVFLPDSGTSTATVDQFTYAAVVGRRCSQSSDLHIHRHFRFTRFCISLCRTHDHRQS